MDHPPPHKVRMTRWAVAVTVSLSWPVLAGTQPASPNTILVLPLHITRAAATTVASCTLIARDDRTGAANLYFVTAAHLFVASAGDRAEPISSVVIDTAGRHMAVRPDDVVLPTGTLVDLALLRATVAASDLTPQPLAFTPPAAGEPFTINGIADGDGRVDVPQRVRFASTLFAVGDRDVSHLAGCIGAAASATAGTFGIVTACEPRKAPSVTLLGPARGFLERHIRTMRTGRVTS
jgi:hypothetical protein